MAPRCTSLPGPAATASGTPAAIMSATVRPASAHRLAIPSARWPSSQSYTKAMLNSLAATGVDEGTSSSWSFSRPSWPVRQVSRRVPRPRQARANRWTAGTWPSRPGASLFRGAPLRAAVMNSSTHSAAVCFLNDLKHGLRQRWRFRRRYRHSAGCNPPPPSIRNLAWVPHASCTARRSSLASSPCNPGNPPALFLTCAVWCQLRYIQYDNSRNWQARWKERPWLVRRHRGPDPAAYWEQCRPAGVPLARKLPGERAIRLLQVVEQGGHRDGGVVLGSVPFLEVRVARRDAGRPDQGARSAPEPPKIPGPW